jgi:DNA gyrase subunit A
METVEGPDFPTGGIVMGKMGVREGYLGRRGRITLRARAEIVEEKGKTPHIVIKEVPYQVSRNKLMEDIGNLVKEERIKDITAVRDESSARNGEPVRIVVEIKRGSDPHLVLNQIYQFSPLQKTVSIGMLALVDGRPQFLTLKEMMQKYLDHRTVVIRRRTQFLLREAKRRSHVLEGQLIAISSIDEVIRICRSAPSRSEAKLQLQGMEVSPAVMERALGAEAFALLRAEIGIVDVYRMTEAQAEAVVRLQLGQLANLERDEILKEFNTLRGQIRGYEALLADDEQVNAIIRSDLEEMSAKYGDARRTEITDADGDVEMEELIADEPTVVTLSHDGFIKRMPVDTYRVQNRGGKGVQGGTRENDFIEHLFVASTKAFLLCFTDKGQCYWLKVYRIPAATRTSAGRSLANVLALKPDEKIESVIPIRQFEEGAFLLMATRAGYVKKTELMDYSRPRTGGIIGISLDDGDRLIDVCLTKPGDEVVLSTRQGMAIRFGESDARSMGRNARGVRGINLREGDELVGMVVADPEGALLTVCENGYAKRTPFGPNTAADVAEDEIDETLAEAPAEAAAVGDDEEAPADKSSMKYRKQRRGGKGVKDVKLTDKNGPIIGVAAVRPGDEIMLISQGGMVTRSKIADIREVGRNTQGVRVMNLTDGDKLATFAKLAGDAVVAGDAPAGEPPAPVPPAPEAPQ